MADMTVSGPAQYATRTDLQGYTGRQAAQYIPGMPYGEGQATYNDQTQANLAATEQPAGAMGGGMTAGAVKPNMDFNRPNANTNNEVTHGASFGPGGGSEVLPTAPQAPDETAATLRALAAMFPDPDLVRLVQRLSAEGR